MKLDQLLTFIDKASRATYAGDGPREKRPERPGFTELIYQKGDFHYRDGYTGYLRSRGMEVVRFKDKPVWSSLYGGGMINGHEKLAHDSFEFLKSALRSASKPKQHVRGPKQLTKGVWRYSYQQLGDKTEFDGHEEIFHRSQLVFFHRIIGGLIKHKPKVDKLANLRPHQTIVSDPNKLVDLHPHHLSVQQEVDSAKRDSNSRSSLTSKPRPLKLQNV